MMAASFLSIGELAITDEEAESLAKAITGVSQLYDMPLLDPKTAAWGNLAMVAANVYGTRVAAVVMGAKGKPKKPAQPKTVTMPGPAYVNEAPVQ